MSDHNDCSGMAALTICEALLLAIHDHKILPEREVLGVLRDAAATHENAAAREATKEATKDADSKMHLEAAKLINQILAGGIQEHSPRYPSS